MSGYKKISWKNKNPRNFHNQKALYSYEIKGKTSEMDMKAGLNKWRGISCFWIGELNIVKKISPQLANKLNAISTQCP